MAFRLKAPDEIEAIALAGERVWDVLQLASDCVRMGMRTNQIDRFVRDRCDEVGLQPSMPLIRDPMIPGPFGGACSISVNDEAAHASPSDRVIDPGDLVTLDLAASFKDWHADAAVSVVVSTDDVELMARQARLVEASLAVTCATICAIMPGGLWSHAARAAHQEADRLGVSILPGLGGHGVGRALHEQPQVRFDAQPGSGHDLRLEIGTVITIEPVVTRSLTDPIQVPGEWCIRTGTGQAAACEERTIAIEEGRVRVLTGPGMDCGG